MSEMVPILGHILLTMWLGAAILAFLPTNQNDLEKILSWWLIGLFCETQLVCVFIFSGLSLSTSLYLLLGLTILISGLAVALKKVSWPKIDFSLQPLTQIRWFEWLLILTVLEKVLFAFWLLTDTPLYADDSLSHWAGRARALYGQVNWSYDSDSSVFLGHVGTANYPLGMPIWRALTAVINGSWNDALARFDSLPLFISAVAASWSVMWRLTEKRWLAAASAFLICALPLQAWHAAAGYGEVAVEAYSAMALLCLVRRDWLLCGVFAIGMGWFKNDGSVILFPGFALAVLLMNYDWQDLKNRKFFNPDKLKNIGCFIAGCLAMAPWLIIKMMFGLGFAPKQYMVMFESKAPGKFLEYVIFGMSHGVFWFAAIIILAVTIKYLIKNQTGRALVTIACYAMAMLTFVFCFTNMSEFLLIQTTIHRSMMHLYPLATSILLYGVYLSTQNIKSKRKRKKA